MKDLLVSIQQKKQAYSELPFFVFLRDETINPVERLAFIPCASPFIMGFSDLCKYSLRQEPTEDKIQAILNQHTYEDDFHWEWFLEDMQKLGLNCSLSLNESLQFIWSDQTKTSRLLTYELYSLIAQAEPIEKFAIVEAIEMTANVFLSSCKIVIDQLELTSNQEYQYFGKFHLGVEDSHNAHSDDVYQFIENIYISDKTRQKSIDLVEKVFEVFTQWTDGLLSYAQSSQLPQSLDRQLSQKQILKVASASLL